MMLALLLVLAVPVINVSSAQTSLYDNNIIHVYKNGNDTESCLSGQEIRQEKLNQYCKTLEFVADRLRNSGLRNVIIIVETPIIVKKIIAFNNHIDLTIQGRGKGTYLNCNCYSIKANSSGILLIDIKGLKLKHFNIMRCCGVDNRYNASVLIKNCSDVTILDSQIYSNDISSGLILLNPAGLVTIHNCKFLNNNVARTSNDVSITGAGLHIEFSQYMLTNVLISQCEFANNKLPGEKKTRDAPSPLDVTNKREWKRENIGGGMAIVFLNRSDAIKINISNCSFMNNHAKWGGGLCIYVQKETYNIVVSVSNSTFVKNTAYRGGGGLQVRLGELNKKSQNCIYFEGALHLKETMHTLEVGLQ